ncbi:CADN-like protein [Mya arenaria]|uniref:CADN-like protein n=1 Tax=Mya arenaria TaxID=6604 RepID=A0ABY7GAC2_MYAAR|nr:CADN-like protein [Mya arenaria]
MFVQSKRFIVDNTPSSHNASCFDSKNDCDFLNMTYIDGHWSDWGPWSECTVSCGSGPRSRVRSCDNPPPVRGGVDCFGSDNDQDVCVLETCPDGWDSWSDWSTCSETCGTGLKRRQRTCTDTKGTQFGGGCIGNDQEQKECNIKSCDTVVLFYSHVDGHWSDWGLWSGCDVTCGNGARLRVRSCNNPAPVRDGWDRWSDWSSCSVTCGPGFKHRYRTCNDTIETILGGGCVGNDQEYTECNMKSCEMIVLFYADGPRNTNISINETIVYSSVTTNIGGGYNSTSGVFIAPHEGLFLFTSQTCIQAGNSIWVGIVKDGAMIQDSMLSSTKDDTCNSMQAAVQLRVEERVWIQGTWTSVLFENYYRRCSFSGMLIQ